ncbi:Peptidase family M23 [Acinetobacter marinus]|uniref:Peptidase family M23 n=1 Tax=Acinetobacter marinus TaxID=281375 RepID=A0A1G6MW30_9GAMM|nr:M23 family metallopeptidase [Acinetobacter marinus]SDC59749.1 Peptidase family M23 [Acinetobacter marinus]
MHIRRFLLALSFASSAMSVAFADYQSLNSMESMDRLEQLSRTLGKGSYSQDEKTISNATLVSASQDNSVEFNNASLSKYGSSSSNAWMSAHPLPDSRVSSSYGTRTLLGTTRKHSGIDLAAPSGTPIYTTGAGVVTKSGWGSGYGYYVEVDHNNGYKTRYAHASRLIAKVGDYVNAGEHIANVGCTGRCTGPHLHFEVVKNDKRQNPSTYLALLP